MQGLGFRGLGLQGLGFWGYGMQGILPRNAKVNGNYYVLWAGCRAWGLTCLRVEGSDLMVPLK